MRGNDGLRQFSNIHFLPLDRAIGQFAVIVEQLFDQLLQIAAAVIKDLNDFLLFRRQRPRYPVASSSVPSRMLASGVFSSCDR